MRSGQQRDAFCHYESFRTFLQSHALRIKYRIHESHLRFNLTLRTFEHATSCKTAKRAADSTRQASAKHNVPCKIFRRVVIKDWRVIHGSKHTEFKGRT